jgi:hypothetical protein
MQDVQYCRQSAGVCVWPPSLSSHTVTGASGGAMRRPCERMPTQFVSLLPVCFDICTHTHTHERTHASTQARKHASTQARTHARTRARAHTHNAFAWRKANVSLLLACYRTRSRHSLRRRKHMHEHTQRYTYTHTHPHMHTINIPIPCHKSWRLGLFSCF